MLRKISFAFVAAIALGAAAMSPASAGGHGGHKHGGHHGHGHGHHHGHRHHNFYGSSAFFVGGDCYKYVQTRRGVRLVNVCVY